MVYKFIEELESNNILPELMSKLKILEQTYSWTQNHHQIFEEINTTFTSTLINTEQTIAVPSQHSWSIEIDQASSLYSYWLLKVTGNKKKYTNCKAT
jgi:hypothetical protein